MVRQPVTGALPRTRRDEQLSCFKTLDPATAGDADVLFVEELRGACCPSRSAIRSVNASAVKPLHLQGAGRRRACAARRPGIQFMGAINAICIRLVCPPATYSLMREGAPENHWTRPAFKPCFRDYRHA